MSDALDENRRAELVAHLGAVRNRIADACAAVRRDPRAVNLIAVTKGFPAEDVAILASLGVGEFGENRDQEARRKVPRVAELLRGKPTIRWHFVGRVQTNKCRSIARYADVVHAVDRVEVADALSDAVVVAGRQPIGVYIQVTLDRDPSRGGLPTEGILDLAEEIASRPQLELLGIMAIPPLTADPDESFATLAEISETVRRRHPDAARISAGMSGDFELAIKHGATDVRVGTALLGPRRDNLR